tara:strand:+ start:3756 stop:4124 length:369 start_codon:yes stop_codon:yes gene_type:complete
MSYAMVLEDTEGRTRILSLSKSKIPAHKASMKQRNINSPDIKINIVRCYISKASYGKGKKKIRYDIISFNGRTFVSASRMKNKKFNHIHLEVNDACGLEKKDVIIKFNKQYSSDGILPESPW